MSQHYILRRDGCDYQAPDLQTMRTWAQDGRVLPTDMVYSPKYQSWYRAKDLRELRDVLPRADGGRGPASQAPQPVAAAAPQPVAGSQRQAQQFWLRKGEKNYAADSLATILRWASEGNIGPNDFIYHPAYNKWFRAGDSPQLASRFPNSVTAAPTQAAAAPQATTPTAAQPAESADSVQRTVMDFKAAELHRMIQARRAEQAQAAQATRGNTRQGMAVAEIVAEAHRDQGRLQQPVEARRPRTGSLSSAGVAAAEAASSAVDTLRERHKATEGEAGERVRPKLPTLPRAGRDELAEARSRAVASVAAAEATGEVDKGEVDKGEVEARRPSPPALPKAVLEAKAEDEAAGETTGDAAGRERPVDPSTGAPQVAPVSDADAGTGVDQGMAVPPDAAAAVAVRYDDRLNLMKLFYDVARAFVVTKDMRPGEAQETKCALPSTGDSLQGQTKRSIYTLITQRMKAHLEGEVVAARAELEPDEIPGYELFLERASTLLAAFEAAVPVVGQKPPERFVIGNSGRAKISPDESQALLRIEACLKGLISIRAK
ncbi:MAG: hypothetical protein H6702_02975 [Myxococcales bacterium]|nr:hypothetical protein [Myxococcales bacterium]